MGYYETTGYDGGRAVDVDAIQQTFSQYGATYYGDGSEFIYSAGGYELVNDIAVRNAAERAAQEARESKMAEATLIKMLAARQREAMRTKYYKMGHTLVWFATDSGLNRALLIHDAKANCPYCFNASGEIGPFVNMGEAMLSIDDYYGKYMPTCPCPVCTQAMYNPDEETMSILDACKKALVSGRYHKEDYIKPKTPVAPPKPTIEYREPTALSKVRFMYEKSPSMPFLNSVKIDNYTVVREISSDGRHNVYQLDIVFNVPASLSGKLPHILEDVMILMRRYKDIRPISDEEKWRNINNTPISSFEERTELIKTVPLTLISDKTKTFSDGTALALYRVNLIIDENDSPFTDGVYLFYLEVGGTKIARFSIYLSRKLPEQADKPCLFGNSSKEYVVPKRSTAVAQPSVRGNAQPQASSKQHTQPQTQPETPPKQNSPVQAQPVESRPFDNRTYKQNPISVDAIISDGSDPSIRNMRMEGFTVKITPNSIVYTVTINTTTPLKVGSTINLITCCIFNYTAFLGVKNLIPEDMMMRKRKAKIVGAPASPYQGQNCYTLEIGLSPLEWKKNSVKGNKAGVFMFEILGVPYLEGSDRLSGVYSFS